MALEGRYYKMYQLQKGEKAPAEAVEEMKHA
jgi:hypothetical protein